VLVTTPCLLLTAGPLASGTHFNAAIGIPALAAFVFLVQLLNLPPMGKRVGLSVMAGCLIHAPHRLAFKIPIAWMVDILFGVGMAFVGVTLPWPKFASEELRYRQSYIASASREIIYSLLAGLHGKLEARSAKAADHRRELMNYVQKNIVVCQIRIAEARCGPHWRRSLNEDAVFLRTLDEIFMSTKVMNDIFSSIDFTNLTLCDMLVSKMRPELSRLNDSLMSGLGFMAQWTPGQDGTACGTDLRTHADAFDRAFRDARQQVFFSPGSPPTEPRVWLTLYAFLFELDVVAGILWAFLAGDEPIMKRQTCCRGNLLAVLIPSQQHLRDFCQWPLKPHAKRHLILALKLTLAMVIAALYGFCAFPTPHSLPAFTIAYVGVETLQGTNMSLSVLRSAGTLVSAIYAELVAQVASAMPEPATRGFVLAAIVLFTIPATYVRSSTNFSYAGNTAAFTCILLLLNIVTQSNAEAQITVHQRIAETLVGVAIFIFTDMFVFPLRSDSQLFRAVAETLGAVRSEVDSARRNLSEGLGANSVGTADPPSSDEEEGVTEASVDSEVPLGSDSETELADGLGSLSTVDVLRGGVSLQDLPSHAQRLGLISAQRALLQFSGQEPSLWRSVVNGEYIRPVLDIELRMVVMSLQLTRIVHLAACKSSRLPVPACFSELEGGSARTQVIDPMIDTFDELMGDADSWFDHLASSVQSLDLGVHEIAKRRALAGFAGVPDEDAMRSEAEAIRRAAASLLVRFGDIARDCQLHCLGGAGAEGSPPGMPPNATVKVAGAFAQALRMVLEALADLEAPLARAHAARLLASTQRPLQQGHASKKLPPLAA